MCVCVCKSVCVCVSERESVCVCVSERESVCVSVCYSEGATLVYTSTLICILNYKIS